MMPPDIVRVLFRTKNYGLCLSPGPIVTLWVLGNLRAPRSYINDARGLQDGTSWIRRLQDAYDTRGVDVVGKSQMQLKKELGPTNLTRIRKDRETMKRCPKCETAKPLKDFSFRNREKGTRRHYCRPCTRTYNRELSRRKNKFAPEKGCGGCGHSLLAHDTDGWRCGACSCPKYQAQE